MYGNTTFYAIAIKNQRRLWFHVQLLKNAVSTFQFLCDIGAECYIRRVLHL